jgi:hypothetical protein
MGDVIRGPSPRFSGGGRGGVAPRDLRAPRALRASLPVG